MKAFQKSKIYILIWYLIYFNIIYKKGCFVFPNNIFMFFKLTKDKYEITMVKLNLIQS